MWIYEDDNRTLEFEDFDQIRAFVLNEIAPGHLARALADNMMSIAAEMGYDNAEYLKNLLADAMMGDAKPIADVLEDALEEVFESGGALELETIGVRIEYRE